MFEKGWYQIYIQMQLEHTMCTCIWHLGRSLKSGYLNSEQRIAKDWYPSCTSHVDFEDAYCSMAQEPKTLNSTTLLNISKVLASCAHFPRQAAPCLQAPIAHSHKEFSNTARMLSASIEAAGTGLDIFPPRLYRYNPGYRASHAHLGSTIHMVTASK